MKIEKINNNLVLTIPLTQKESNCYMDEEDLRDVPNLIGIIAGDEYSISWLIDLSYKGDQQEGMPIIMFDDRESLEEACKTLGLGIWEHETCKYCGKVIRGCSTWGKKGAMCFECENKEKELKK